MKSVFAFSALALALTTGAVLAPSAHAANARHPYSNIDRRNDAGNDTGDSQVDRLNSAQLDENYNGGGMGQGQATQGGPSFGGGASPYGATQ